VAYAAPGARAIRAPRAAGSLALALAGSAAAIAAFLAPTSSNSATASSLGQAQALAAELQARVMAQARLVHRLAVRYQQAAGVATLLSEEVASARSSVAELRHRLGSTEAMLREEALQSYAGGVLPEIGEAAGATQAAERATYLEVTTGDISDTLDLFRAQQSQLSSALGALDEQMQNASAAQRRALVARQQALAQASRLQGLLDQARQRVIALAAQAKLEAQAAQARLAAQAKLGTERQHTMAGPPVGDGVVAALTQELGPGLLGESATPLPAGGVWLSLRECESGDNYRANTGNGFYGAYQFSESTWLGLGFQSRPDLAAPWLQDQAAQRLETASGWGQWPACSAALGL